LELHDFIANKLGITKDEEKNCIKNIIGNTVVLNEYRTGKMSENKLDILVKITGAYISELLEVMHNPDKYKERVDLINRRIAEVANV